ncbi:MAG: hypothetical protein Q9225_001854 [Loekoesia sp. 1 TL-2023]
MDDDDQLSSSQESARVLKKSENILSKIFHKNQTSQAGSARQIKRTWTLVEELEGKNAHLSPEIEPWRNNVGDIIGREQLERQNLSYGILRALAQLAEEVPRDQARRVVITAIRGRISDNKTPGSSKAAFLIPRDLQGVRMNDGQTEELGNSPDIYDTYRPPEKTCRRDMSPANFWLGAPSPARTNPKDTDFTNRERYEASVTPIHIPEEGSSLLPEFGNDALNVAPVSYAKASSRNCSAASTDDIPAPEVDYSDLGDKSPMSLGDPPPRSQLLQRMIPPPKSIQQSGER